MKNYITLLLLVAMQPCFCQVFYVNRINYYTYENELFEANLSDCTLTPITICPPISSEYYDIAADAIGNLYLGAADGNLYRQNLETGSCALLGFTDTGINALVADTKSYVYGAGPGGIFKYNVVANTFEFMGTIPEPYMSAGDMFFYDERLFLTVITTDFTTTALLEIKTGNTADSCIVGTIPFSYAAFAIDYGEYSKAYLIDTDNYGNNFLKEVDMETYTVGDEICFFDNSNNMSYGILGAATVYERTSFETSCILDTDTFTEYYINIANPCYEHINLETNIDHSYFSNLTLYDMTGRIIKQVKPENILNFDVQGIASGSYIIQFEVSGKGSIARQIIIK
jgi:Secretion system C-terminal sorting domain